MLPEFLESDAIVSLDKCRFAISLVLQRVPKGHYKWAFMHCHGLLLLQLQSCYPNSYHYPMHGLSFLFKASVPSYRISVTEIWGNVESAFGLSHSSGYVHAEATS